MDAGGLGRTHTHTELVAGLQPVVIDRSGNRILIVIADLIGPDVWRNVRRRAEVILDVPPQDVTGFAFAVRPGQRHAVIVVVERGGEIIHLQLAIAHIRRTPRAHALAAAVGRPYPVIIGLPRQGFGVIEQRDIRPYLADGFRLGSISCLRAPNGISGFTAIEIRPRHGHAILIRAICCVHARHRPQCPITGIALAGVSAI